MKTIIANIPSKVVIKYMQDLNYFLSFFMRRLNKIADITKRT